MIMIKNVNDTYKQWKERFFNNKHSLQEILELIEKNKELIISDHNMALHYQKALEKDCFDTSTILDACSYYMLDNTRPQFSLKRLNYINKLNDFTLRNKDLVNLIGLGLDVEKLHSIFILSLITVTNSSIKVIDIRSELSDIVIKFTYNNLYITCLSVLKNNYYSETKIWDPEDIWVKEKLNKIVLILLDIGIETKYFTVELNKRDSNKNVEPNKIKHLVKYVYLYEDIKTVILNYVDQTSFKLPMLCKPVRFRKDTSNLLTGGYLSSKDDKTAKWNIVIGIQDHLSIKIRPKFLEAINYVQSQPIVINSLYINHILNQHNKDIKESSKGLIDLDSLWHIPEPSETDYDKLKRLMASSFMIELHIMNILSDMKLYLPWNIDNRGRFYNITYPVSFYTRKEMRPAFNIYTKTNSNKLLDSEKIKDLNIWEHSHYIINGCNSLIGIDATASCYQIISGLCKDINLLECTNVSKPDKIFDNDLLGIKSDHIGKIDIYDILTKICKSEMNYPEIEKFYTEYFEKECNIVKTTMDTIKTPSEFMDMLMKMDRKFYKKFFMTYAYNQSIDGLYKDIAKSLKIPVRKNDKLKSIYYAPMRCAQIIGLCVQKSIKKAFMSVIDFRSFCRTVAGYKAIRNRFIKIRANGGYHTLYQSYKKQETIIIKVWSFKNKEMLSIHKKIIPDEPAMDQIKNKIALSPNLVHYLDSTIMIYVILKCKKNKIPVLPIHDCFYTKIEYLDDIKKFYKKGFIKFIINNNNLEDLINNNIPPEDLVIRNKLFKILSNFKGNIQKEKILESKYILC